MAAEIAGIAVIAVTPVPPAPALRHPQRIRIRVRIGEGAADEPAAVSRVRLSRDAG
ncbi:hypothetical protein GCM10010340_23260 [Streptomyces griseoloalbus]|nr:hypothetical protein GCM10010340_23260 [Streptomyces albaduncus]